MEKRNTGEWLEKKFQVLLKQYLDSYSYKFPDYKVYGKMIAMFPEVANMIQRVPCDRLFVYKGKSFLFELKNCESTSVAFARIKEHQVAHLLHHKRAGGYSFFIFGIDNNVYAIDVDKIASYIQQADRKSIPVQWIKDNDVLIQHILCSI